MQSPSSQRISVAIIGAGIVGLATAFAHAKRGLKVHVFEKNPSAQGASVRNFGMIWPIGQPQGTLQERALKSRAIWRELAVRAGFGLDPCGSLHLAYREDELTVIQEFCQERGEDNSISLLTAGQVAEKSPAAITAGLLGALWSETEMTVDPREVVRTLPGFLHREYAVEFHWGQAVTAIHAPHFQVGGQTWQADQIWVCSGAEFETLYPDLYAASGMTKVKLQMMRTPPQPWRIGPSLCAGLTLTHYAAFARCPSLGLLKERIDRETPYYPRWGIHVMMSQNLQGELVLGDSHEYGLDLDPFDRTEINEAILTYLQGFAQVPSWQIQETWHGIYAKLPGQTEYIAHPEQGVTIVNGLGGAGMTLSWGLMEELVAAVV